MEEIISYPNWGSTQINKSYKYPTSRGTTEKNKGTTPESRQRHATSAASSNKRSQIASLRSNKNIRLSKYLNPLFGQPLSKTNKFTFSTYSREMVFCQI
jgi:hypothetical protein